MIKDKLFSSWKILKLSLKIYAQRFFVFLGIVLVPIVFGILTNLIFHSLIVLLLAIIMAVLQIWSGVALIYAIKDWESGTNIKQAFSGAWKKLKSYVWVSFLLGFVIIGGTMLFVVPGIIFAIWFLFALCIVVVENIKGMNALLKSKAYVKGYWWPVFGRIMVLGLFFATISFIFSLLEKIVDVSWLSLIVNYILTALLTPIAVIYIFCIYKNLQEIKKDFVFSPSKKTKIITIIFAVIGIILIPLLILFSFNFIKTTFHIKIDKLSPEKNSSVVKEDLNPAIFNENLSGLAPKETYFKLLSELEKVKTYDDYIAYVKRYGSQKVIDTVNKYKEQINLLPKTFKDSVIATIKSSKPTIGEITKIEESFKDNIITLKVYTNKSGINIGTVTMVKEGNEWKIESESW